MEDYKGVNVKKIIFLLFFLFSLHIFAFDIREPFSIDWFLGYGKGHLEKKPDYEFSIVGVDFSYPVSNVWTFQLEPFTSYVFNPEDNFEVGIAFFIKYNPFKKKKVSPYIKAGSGIIYISQDNYEQSTDVNFVDQICAGIKFVVKKVVFFIEYRFRHISNAGIKHPNSGLNSNIYLFGFNIPF